MERHLERVSRVTIRRIAKKLIRDLVVRGGVRRTTELIGPSYEKDLLALLMALIKDVIRDLVTSTYTEHGRRNSLKTRDILSALNREIRSRCLEIQSVREHLLAHQ